MRVEELKQTIADLVLTRRVVKAVGLNTEHLTKTIYQLRRRLRVVEKYQKKRMEILKRQREQLNRLRRHPVFKELLRERKGK